MERLDIGELANAVLVAQALIAQEVGRLKKHREKSRI
jgi:hypothetical protein